MTWTLIAVRKTIVRDFNGDIAGQTVQLPDRVGHIHVNVLTVIHAHLALAYMCTAVVNDPYLS